MLPEHVTPLESVRRYIPRTRREAERQLDELAAIQNPGLYGDLIPSANRLAETIVAITEPSEVAAADANALLMLLRKLVSVCRRGAALE